MVSRAVRLCTGLLVCALGAWSHVEAQVRDPGVAVRSALSRGAFADAERAARADMAATLRRSSVTLDDVAGSIDLLVTALIDAGKSDSRETLVLAQRAIRLRRRNVPDDSPSLRDSLDNLGALDSERGEFQRAVLLHRQAVSLREGLAGSPGLADSLERLASALISLDRFDDGQIVLRRARQIREARGEAGSTAIVRNLELTATLDRYRGDFRAARASVDEALRIQRQTLPDHPVVAALLVLDGDIAFVDGDISRARADYATALSLAIRSFGKDHPSNSLYLRRMSNAEWAVANVAEAYRLGTQALEVARRSTAYCHPDILRSMSDLSFPVAYRGDYTRARQLVEDALARAKRCLGDGHSLTATYVHNLGIHLQEMGDLRGAEQLHQQAIALWSAGLGDSHPYVARGLDQLAEVLAAEGELAKAHEMYERALRIRESSLGRDHPDVAYTLTNLARVQAGLGDDAPALANLQRAAAMQEDAGGSQEPDRLARLFELKGELEDRRHDWENARRSFSAALAARERLFGSGHPAVATTRADIARVDFEKGNYQVALNGALQAEQVGRDHLRTTIRYLPERQAMAYAQSRASGLDVALSIAATGAAGAARPAFDALVRSRGIVLDELVARVQFSASGDPRTAPLATAVLTTRQRFANLVMRSLREPVARTILDQAREEKEQAERALAERSGSAQAELRRARAGAIEIRRALPQGTSLVSFVKYVRAVRTVDRGHAGPATPVESYGAFFVRGTTADVRFVSLGPAKEIERMVLDWQDAVRRGSSLSERSYEAAAARLRRAVWDPVLPTGVPSARIFIVPDGLLNVVNVAALPADNGMFLAEQPTVLHYLSTERDLLLEAPSSVSTSLLVAGGPAFDTGAIPPVRREASGFRSACEAFESRQFPDLPGAAQEASEISALWSREGPKGAVTLLSGRGATKTALKRALNGRRVIHLATHGFFLSSDCTAGGDARLTRNGVSSDVHTNATFTENPLLLSGLAFAGANRRAAAPLDADDGILTAEEIAGFNLRGTEWAVLSACDTGLGEIKAGEGVLGLRRAFQIAGARTVIMSLWSVDDRSTRAWMHALYDARLAGNRDTAASVREANLTVLRERRAEGLSVHPFYWAAFVAAGDWR